MNIGIVGLLAQSAPVIESNVGGDETNLIALVLHADIVVQIMLLALVVFSVVSWAIIGSKHRQLKKARSRSKRFFKLFWQAKSIDAIVAKGSFRKSPAFNIFKAGVDSLRDKQENGSGQTAEKEIRRTTEDEIAQMEYGVSFLATTGSACPFIGLFGTIWGILHAFWKIGRTGASSIAIIGPHIAEALISTAIGLAAAIPAVIFYNYYVNSIRLISKDLYDFAEDFNDRIDREYNSAT
ncbi:MAG: Tol-Pal system subunit TolQ [Deltaproteobacteria bacterium]|nr:Tol-Pal system subunit TolQ [Deltaproteobacteria bacterium]